MKAMTLSDYLEKRGLSQAEFGAKFDPVVSQSLMSQWLRGTTRMTLDRAIECKRLTRGQVSVEECAAMYRGEEAAKARAA